MTTRAYLTTSSFIHAPLWLTLCLFVVSLSVLTFGGTARAEESPPVAQGARSGYELGLHGAVVGELGHELALQGVAYVVDNLSALRATKGLAIDASITARKAKGRGREVVTRGKATAGVSGRFQLGVPMPQRALAAPRLELTVHRPGQPGRTFEFGLSASRPHQLDLLTDRQRYEPGEMVRVWVRATTVRGGAPVARSGIRVTMFDASGQTAGEQALQTSAAGVVAFEFPLAESASDGSWRVVATVVDGGLADASERSITVTRRTVERIQASVEIDQELVAPGEILSGRVVVRTPSGSAVRRARVELDRGDGEPLILQTNAEGVAVFRTPAPAFLSGDVSRATLEVRVVHAAHGTIRASASYTISRVSWMVEATPSAGGLVPEVDAELFLSVNDPRGRPIKAGTKVKVRSVGLPGGQVEVTTDSRGLAVVSLELPRGASARRRSGPCHGDVATTVEVEVLAERPVTARLCVPVAAKALVLPRAARPIASPGDDVVVTIQRRPEVRDRPVLVEAIWSGRAVAWAWAEPRQTRVTLQLPDRLQGVVELRARPSWPSDRQRPLDQPGATALGVGASTAILVRPQDAFSLTVEPERELFRVRERAGVQLRASQPPGQGWIALLVRDESAHGGEGPWDLNWIRQELQEAVSGADEPAGDLFLRISLSTLVSPDVPQAEPPPLITPPWASSRSTGSYEPYRASSTGVLRDPVARREELLRRGLAPVMTGLERAVASLGSSERSREGIVRGAGGKRLTFHPQVIANLIASRRLAQQQARTLGGEPLTVAMVTSADGSFTFDRVARRVARTRLVRLLNGLARLADPDNPAAARASSNDPPERWLSVLVQLGMIESEALVDPWGRPFAFRAITGREPAVVVSERSLRFELASPGPDGVLGTADDVRDPFERVVPIGTPYAIASGEDALMEQLSRLATSNRVLQAMTRAYARMGLAAADEQHRGPVEATGSEDLAHAAFEPEVMADGAASDGPADATTAEFARRSAPPGSGHRNERERDRAGEMDFDERSVLGQTTPIELEEGEDAAPMSPAPDMPYQAVTSRSQAMGEMVRERFPATLFFVAETSLDDQGQANVEVPLADALTTYRLEAIAWSASGWTTSSSGQLRVDQEAMVDAPVPPFATVGDHLRLPVRVANRTNAALPVDVEVEAEGDLTLQHQEVTSMEVPPGEAVEAIVDVRVGAIGEGSLLIRAVQRGSGRTLDAVRRPLVVLDNVRLAREVREELLEAGQVLRVEVPDEATPRGPGELRLSVGRGLFGDPSEWGVGGSHNAALWAGWVHAVTEQPIPEGVLSTILSSLPEEEDEWYLEPEGVALSLAVLWRDDRLSDEMAREGLRVISPLLPTEGGVGGETEYMDADRESLVWMLISLAPVLGELEHRPALREDLERLGERLRQQVSSHGAQAEEAPVVWASAAAALALIDPSSDNARALEMVRRATRHVIEVGDESWLEPPTTPGTMLPRVEPSSLLALARLVLGQDREASLSLLRSLTRNAGSAGRWPLRTRAVAATAASMLTESSTPGRPLSVLLDGRAVEVERDQGVVTAVLEGIGQAGTHRIEVRMPRGEVALARLELRYGLPWSVRPEREAQVDVEWTGETGARDGRAGLRLEISNRGARILTRPIVEVELPAGTELDEQTREALVEQLAEPASTEGRTLQLHLRPLAPGGYVRLPLPLRWAVGGTVIGLGTTVWDDTGPTPLAARQVTVVPSRGVTIADRGTEPDMPDAEASPPPRPPCLPPIEPLAEVLR